LFEEHGRGCGRDNLGFAAPHHLGTRTHQPIDRLDCSSCCILDARSSRIVVGYYF